MRAMSASGERRARISGPGSGGRRTAGPSRRGDPPRHVLAAPSVVIRRALSPTLSRALAGTRGRLRAHLGPPRCVPRRRPLPPGANTVCAPRMATSELLRDRPTHTPRPRPVVARTRWVATFRGVVAAQRARRTALLAEGNTEISRWLPSNDFARGIVLGAEACKDITYQSGRSKSHSLRRCRPCFLEDLIFLRVWMEK